MRIASSANAAFFSGGLQYRVASVAGQHTQGATQCTRNIYKQCEMQMSALQESFWRQKKSEKVTMEPIKHNSNKRGNEAKKSMQPDLKQSNRKVKTANQVRLTVLVLRSARREHQETRRKGTNVCHHCGHNDHQRKSSALWCPFNVPVGKVPDHTDMHMINDYQIVVPTVDIVPANTQENVISYACSVASLSLQDRANQANQ